MKKKIICATMLGIVVSMSVGGCSCSSGNKSPIETSIENSDESDSDNTQNSSDGKSDEDETTTNSDITIEDETTTETKKYTLNYDSSGGTDFNVFVETEENNTFMITNEIPLKKGHSFKYWNTSEDGTGDIFKGGQKVTITKDTVLYAVWEANSYNISYVLDGGANEQNPDTYKYGDGLVLKGASKLGHNFVGWYLDPELTIKITEISKSSIRDITLYAKFQACEYDFSIFLNGGKLNNKKGDRNYSLLFDSKYEIPDPEMEGYKFVGWTQGGFGKLSKIGNKTVFIQGAGDGYITANWEEILVSSVILNQKEIAFDMTSGNTTFQLSAITYPETALKKGVTWTSSDESVAYVNANGVVTAKSNGTAVITATSASGITAECKVSVNTSAYAMNMNVSELTLDVTKKPTATLTVSYAPATTNIYKDVKWTTSDSSIATVDANGLVTAKKNGVVIITATSDNNKTASCSVTVNTSVTAININKKNHMIDLTEDEHTDKLIASVYPSTANLLTEITYSSSNEKVATIDQEGNIEYLANGTTTITVKSGNGTTNSYDITVNTSPESVALDNEEFTIDLSSDDITRELEATCSPETVNYKDKITWTSSDDSVATVKDGIIKAEKSGTTIITATTENGKKAECTVTVIKTITGVEINKAEHSFDLGTDTVNTINLNANVLPNDTTQDKTVTWTSSDENVATVDTNGLVTAIANGTTTITATTINGKSATTNIVVNTTATGVNIVKDTLELDLTSMTSESLQTVFTPVNANLGTGLVWTSSDETVVRVDNTGLVTAVGTGSASIVVTTENNHTDICDVTVIRSIAGISLNKTEHTFDLTTDTDLTLELEATIVPDETTQDKTITWTSSNENVATVDTNGLVTAIANGTTTITATTVNGKSATCIVTVNTSATGVNIIKDSIQLDVNNTNEEQLAIEYTPATANINTEITWTSSDDTTAIVDANGVVTGLKSGTVTITATTKAGATDTCSVVVVTGIKEIVASNVSLDLAEGFTGSGASITGVIPFSVNPTSYDVEAPIFSMTTTLDSSKVTLSLEDEYISYLVTDVCSGTITLSDQYGHSKVIEFVVDTSLKGISIEGDEEIYVDASKENETELSLILNPTDYSENVSCEWTSSDNVNATVNGTISGATVSLAAQGTYVITVKCGIYTESVTIIYGYGITEIQTDVESIQLNLNGEASVTGKINSTVCGRFEDSGGVIYSVKDESSPGSITVDSEGNITATSTGSATIVVTSDRDSTIYKEIPITVI